MANENQSQQNIQETAASLSGAQQQYATRQNDAFKESINLLNKMNKLLDDSVSKTQSFEKSAINIKRIQQERERVERRSENLAKEISRYSDTERRSAEDYLSNIKERRRLEEDIIKRRQTGQSLILANGRNLQAELQTINATIEAEEARLANQKDQLDLIAKIQSQEGLQERVELIGEELDKEKQIQKELGLTGGALKLLNKYLLFGKDTYGKMVEEAREGDKTTKKWVATAALLSAGLYGAYQGIKKFTEFGNKAVGALTGGGGPFSKLAAPFTDLIKGIPVVGGLIGGVVDMLAGVADYATEAGSQVQLFARNLGMSVADATKLNAQYSNIAAKSGDLLYNSKKFRETQMEIAEATGRNNLLSIQELQTQIQLKEIAGIDLETRKQLVDLQKISGVQEDKIVKASMGTSNFLKQTLGVSIKWQTILKEATSLSGVLGLSFAKYPEKLTRSLVTVKAMGLELKQLDALADSFLDFESSISKEFEAQLLTGKDINLAKAREAFLNNDLVAAGKELVNQLGTSGEFLSYNRIQQDALAASAGMTRDQVADMLKQQELFSKFQVTDIKAYQQKVALMSKTIEGQKELVGLLGEEEYSKVMSQTATEKIANFIEKIKQSFADLLGSSSFQAFIDKIIKFISDPKQIEGFLSKITGFISMMIQGLSYMIDAADVVVRVLSLGTKDIPNNIAQGIRGFASEIGSMKIGALSPAGVSVGGNAANAQAQATSAAQNNMSMAGTAGGNTPNQTFYFVNKNEISDTAKAVEDRMTRAIPMDRVTG